MEIETLPQPIDSIDRNIRGMKIELQALARETDKAAVERAELMQEEMRVLEEQANEMRAKWMSEKEAIDAIRNAKERLEEASHQLDIAEREGDYEGASRIKFGEIPELKGVIEQKSKKLLDLQGEDGGVLREMVTDDDIADAPRTGTLEKVEFL